MDNSGRQIIMEDYNNENSNFLQQPRWHYIGRQDDQLHGPYASQEMITWMERGYFQPHHELMLRLSQEEHYYTWGELLQHCGNNDPFFVPGLTYNELRMNVVQQRHHVVVNSGVPMQQQANNGCFSPQSGLCTPSSTPTAYGPPPDQPNGGLGQQMASPPPQHHQQPVQMVRSMSSLPPGQPILMMNQPPPPPPPPMQGPLTAVRPGQPVAVFTSSLGHQQQQPFMPSFTPAALIGQPPPTGFLQFGPPPPPGPPPHQILQFPPQPPFPMSATRFAPPANLHLAQHHQQPTQMQATTGTNSGGGMANNSGVEQTEPGGTGASESPDSGHAMTPYAQRDKSVGTGDAPWNSRGRLVDRAAGPDQPGGDNQHSVHVQTEALKIPTAEAQKWIEQLIGHRVVFV